MVVQIFGTKKCKDTQKAVRFFKERNIKTQFINLKEKGVSAGELKSISNSVPLKELVDGDGKEIEKRELEYILYGPEQSIFDKLLDFPLLLKTPIVRNGKKATLGVKLDVWKEWK